ncbi:class I SAM-dependent rRNA methyltransferase [Deinococcus hopiensis]|uniref:23S rRNA (Cytosine1962-C5)-methyltransferase n=1 Tax=Deinococcus hopiensis KR-140 TaxID=695939 RepID=A0A1W1VDI3_9DEIO|nr:class I SAM-dependent methyltransferase [Deinococcus hopiensis]SMB91497.1 23S rRNA (cytosine1962-C5)-methyltransferase [Deinococcus hopiensis KR-140]
MLLPDLPVLLARRAHLPDEGTTVFRVAHTTETAGQFAVDLVGDAAVLSLYVDVTAEEEGQLVDAVGHLPGVAGAYLKRRPVEARHAANVAREWLSPPDPVWGEARPEVTALEGGVPFLLRPGADLSIGLFPDARPLRAWVREHAPVGGRVLNTFAYTCGFGLNASLGGAEGVKNVDLSRKVLAWGQQNYALSGLAAPNTDFLYGDVFEWLRRLTRRGDTFDLVILDPPSFARGKSGMWRAERDYAGLVALAARVVEPGGQLLAVTNHAGVSPRSFEGMGGTGLDQAGRRGAVTQRLGAGEDYPGAAHLKALVWALD